MILIVAILLMGQPFAVVFTIRTKTVFPADLFSFGPRPHVCEKIGEIFPFVAYVNTLSAVPLIAVVGGSITSPVHCKPSTIRLVSFIGVSVLSIGFFDCFYVKAATRLAFTGEYVIAKY